MHRQEAAVAAAMVSLHFIFILVIIHCNPISPMKIPQDSLYKNVKKNDGLQHRLFKRQNKCLEDEYIADNYCCKNCKVGSIVVSDCVKPEKNPECKECTEGVDYMDKPSGYHQCQRCSPCESSSGLEVLHSCTKSRNTICQCMKEFVCSENLPSPDGGCNKCVHQSLSDDGGGSLGTILGSILGACFILVIIGVAIYFWKRKQRENNGSPRNIDQNSPFIPDPENVNPPPPHENVDLETHLYEIAGKIENRSVMKLATKMLSSVDIDDIKNSCPNDYRDQRYQLLRKWYNAQGCEGALEALLKACTKKEAEEIQQLIST